VHRPFHGCIRRPQAPDHVHHQRPVLGDQFVDLERLGIPHHPGSHAEGHHFGSAAAAAAAPVVHDNLSPRKQMTYYFHAETDKAGG
jgi:hypothetical protein